MEMALGPLCGSKDIVTPMESNWESEIPRNYFEDKLIGRAYARSRLLRRCVNRHSPIIGRWYYEHMPAWRVRQLLGEGIWNSYYKFCFERNPWEKVVSYYNWKKFGQKKKMPTFRDYVLKKTHRLPIDSRLYFDGDQCIVDEVLDFKGFVSKFEAVCTRLGIPFNGDMPTEKTNIVNGTVDYRDYYDDETRQKIYESFNREINLMGYEFWQADGKNS